MTEVTAEGAGHTANIGWRVALAGMGINLALGILYTWSVISKGIPDAWHWSEAQKSLPYAIACLVFCLVMVPAGRLQDKIGPRPVASVGGLLVGAGMILASLSTSPIGYVIGFGILAGAGIGAGYASATPPAVKWFPPAKTGQIAGIVVSGFGLASVYAAPLAKWLTATFGLPTMMKILGIAFLVVVVSLAQLLRPPPPRASVRSRTGPTWPDEGAEFGPGPEARGLHAEADAQDRGVLPSLVHLCLRRGCRVDGDREAGGHRQDSGRD